MLSEMIMGPSVPCLSACHVLHPNFAVKADPATGEIKHQKWLSLHDDSSGRSKEEFAKHFSIKYSGENPLIGGAMGHRGNVIPLRRNQKGRPSRCRESSWNRPNIPETWLRSINVAGIFAPIRVADLLRTINPRSSWCDSFVAPRGLFAPLLKTKAPRYAAGL